MLGLSIHTYAPPNEVRGYIISRSKGFSIDDSLRFRRKNYDIFDAEEESANAVPFTEIYPIKVGKTYRFFTSTRKFIVDSEGNVFTNLKDLCSKYGVGIKKFTDGLKRGENLQQCIDGAVYKPPARLGKATKAPNGRVYKTLGGLLSAYGVPKGTYDRRQRDGWELADCLVLSTSKYHVTYLGIRQPFVSKRTKKRMFYVSPASGGDGTWMDAETYLKISGLNDRAMTHNSKYS